MGKTIPVLPSVRATLLALALMLAVLLSWATVAQAQTAFKGQYGNPTRSGEAAILSASEDSSPSDPSGGTPTASGEAALTASADPPSSAGSSGLTASADPPSTAGSSGLTGLSDPTGSPATSSGVASLIATLPDTGGPLVPLLALGVLAIGFGGFLMLTLRRLETS